jgi:hypothetical protein
MVMALTLLSLVTPSSSISGFYLDRDRGNQGDLRKPGVILLGKSGGGEGRRENLEEREKRGKGRR